MRGQNTATPFFLMAKCDDIGTVTDWDQLPLTLRAQHLAATYDLSLYRVRALMRKGDTTQIPRPAFISPARWRKSDVRRHYERADPVEQRLARVKARRSGG